MTRAFLWMLFVATSLYSCQSPSAPPEDTVKAFAKALAKDDFPAMARLVVEGKPDFDYRKLRGDDQQRDRVYVQFDIKVKDVKVEGDRATVTISYICREKGNELSGSSEKEIVPLQLVDGEWKIVPYTETSPTGYFIEELAGMLANPQAEFEMIEKAYAPTRNLGAANEKLGQDRRDFFVAILQTYGPSRNYVPYTGYKSMTMVEHTSVMWPVGKSDEVVFNMGLEQASYLTYWKKVNGKPKRIFQYKLFPVTYKLAPFGTLNIVLSKSRYHFDKGVGENPRALLRLTRPYACYIEVGAIGSFVCTVTREDGSRDPSTPNYSAESIMQDSHQLFKRGFFITPAEQMLIAHPKSNP